MTYDDDFRSRAQQVRLSARAHLLEIRQARLSKRFAAKAPQLPPEPVTPEAEAIPTEAELLQSLAPQVDQPATLNPAGADSPQTPSATISAEMPSDTPPTDTAMTDESMADNVQVAQTLAPDTLETETPDTTTMAVTEIPPAPRPKRKARPKVAATTPIPALASSNDRDLSYDQSVQEAALADLGDTEPPPPPLPAVISMPAGSAETEPDCKPEPEPAVATTSDPIPPPEPHRDHIADLTRLPGAGPGLIWMLQQCDIRSMQDLAAVEATELTSKLGLVGQILNVQTWLDYARHHVAADRAL